MFFSEFLKEIKFLLKYRISGELLYRQHHEELKTFCVSLCFGNRLGFLYNALLGAHPNVLQMRLGYFTRDMLKKEHIAYLCSYALWYQNPKRLPEISAVIQAESSPWHRKPRKLQVLLDTCGHLVLENMFLYPDDLATWLEHTCIPAKVIHTELNPFDFLAKCFHHQYPGVDDSSQKVSRMDFIIKAYFKAYCASINKVYSKHPESILVLHAEDIRKDLTGTLKQGLDFLQLEHDAAYLHACDKIEAVDHEPAPRTSYPWTPEQISQVEMLLQTQPYLKHYRFAS